MGPRGQVCPESEQQLGSSLFTSNGGPSRSAPCHGASSYLCPCSEASHWLWASPGWRATWQTGVSICWTQKTVTEKAALGSLPDLAFPLTSRVIKAVKDQRRGGDELRFALALNVLLLQMGTGPHLLAEVILGLHGAPNPICGQGVCCFWKAIPVAKCPVKMQSSSQTKDLIKDHFSFTACFTTTAVYGTLNSFTAPLPLPWVYWP